MFEISKYKIIFRGKFQNYTFNLLIFQIFELKYEPGYVARDNSLVQVFEFSKMPFLHYHKQLYHFFSSPTNILVTSTLIIQSRLEMFDY